MGAHFHIPDRGLQEIAGGDSAPVVVGLSHPPVAEPYQKALRLWLQWNQAYENVVTRMFRAGEDRKALEDIMDQMDWLRKDAVELSRHLLK